MTLFKIGVKSKDSRGAGEMTYKGQNRLQQHMGQLSRGVSQYCYQTVCRGINE